MFHGECWNTRNMYSYKFRRQNIMTIIGKTDVSQRSATLYDGTVIWRLCHMFPVPITFMSMQTPAKQIELIEYD